ncbi:MAG: general secretion pathway protein [Burkholderiaceae bacterium]|nr:general secretion pathway protein [Burkholderiaceae bacterium]
MTRYRRYTARHAWWAALVHAHDRWRFMSLRADYYDYLAALLQGMRGARTLKDVFQADASRYGASSVRGRLSARWLRTFQLSSGDLYSTWLAEFPVAELGLIRMAQSFGNTTLVNTLAELARVLMLTRQAGQIVMTTLWAAALALMVALLLMAAVPWFTVPRLFQAFATVPPEYYGSMTRQLIAWSELIRQSFVFLMVLCVGGWAVFLWSLPNTSGPIRKTLDAYVVWRIYRHVQALRFLALLSLVLGRDDSGSTQLRRALLLKKQGASPWQVSHIDAMLARIDGGITGAATFDTGLLDREHYWFFSDMVMARGLSQGLALTSERLRLQVLGVVARQAAVLRWTMLLACLALVLGLGLWHYAVIDELRRSLMIFHANQ